MLYSQRNGQVRTTGIDIGYEDSLDIMRRVLEHGRRGRHGIDRRIVGAHVANIGGGGSTFTQTGDRHASERATVAVDARGSIIDIRAEGIADNRIRRDDLEIPGRQHAEVVVAIDVSHGSERPVVCHGCKVAVRAGPGQCHGLVGDARAVGGGAGGGCKCIVPQGARNNAEPRAFAHDIGVWRRDAPATVTLT